MKKLILILFFINYNTFFGSFYFSDITKETNNNIIDEKEIVEIEEILQTEYSINTNNIDSFFEMKGTNIINQNGVISSPILESSTYTSHPFRYTEVTFLLTAFFSYTYATFIVFGLDAIENANITTSTTGRSRYKRLWISSTLFEITAAVFCGAAVAYDSYQRVFGKNKNDGFTFNFVPIYEPINKEAGFLFTLSHPL